MSRQDCIDGRPRDCLKWGKEQRKKCDVEEDQGHDECIRERDAGYRQCCDWVPCSWFCKAWVWISHIVCEVWNHIENWVCIAWSFIWVPVCLVWTLITFPICLIAPNITKVFDRWTDWVADRIEDLIGAIGHLIDGSLYAIRHPVESIETVFSILGGCPDVRSDRSAKPLIVGHHGYTKKYPENTAQSCRQALDRGAQGLEIDLCITADGNLVLWHDWDPDDPIAMARKLAKPELTSFLPKSPDLGSPWRRPVDELTLAEFRDHYTYKEITSQEPLTDLYIPTLQEFMAKAAAWADLRLLCLDVKAPDSGADHGPAIVDKIHEALPAERSYPVVVMVPSLAVLRRMKARSDEEGYGLAFSWDREFPAGVILNPLRYSAIDSAVIPLHNSAASVGRPTAATAFAGRTYRRTIAYDIERWNEVNADPASMNAGQPIDHLIAWTINVHSELQCLAKMGVSAIITDDPERLREILAGLP